MSSKILKSFIKVAFYEYQLYVNFLQKKTSKDHLNDVRYQICRLNDTLNYFGVYYKEIYFDFWLVQP